MVKVQLTADVPQDLMQALLQHMRDFDSAHPGCHFQILAFSESTLAEIEAVIDQILPGFEHRQTFRKQ